VVTTGRDVAPLACEDAPFVVRTISRDGPRAHLVLSDDAREEIGGRAFVIDQENRVRTVVKDGQFWALLENSTEYADFLEFIRAYARTRSSSRTTTELLFLMDELAQGNQEVAQTVLGTSVSHDLAYTATVSPRAALLAASIANDLHAWLASHRYTESGGVEPAYDQVRLRILSTIVETSPDGYRESDARFLAGEIFFRQDRFEEAMQWWLKMRPRDGDTYGDAAKAILAILEPGKVDVFALRRVLWKESARWHDVNYSRLKQFGFRCDSY
jgi:hypothetical protein